MSDEGLTGTVKMYRGENGYGFISSHAMGEDTFFHVSVVKSREEPRSGMVVRFKPEEDPRNPRRRRASWVELLR
jgi:cold shock CspA family protein